MPRPQGTDMLAYRRVIPAAVVLALAAFLSGLAAATAGAAGRHAAVRLALRPHGAVPADGLIRARAAVRRPRRTVRVVFSIDGRRAGADRQAPFALVRPAVSLRAGRHLLRAVAIDRAGRRHVASRPLDVGRAALPRASAGASGDSAWARGRSWVSSFESGNFTEWSWWGQGQENIWGHIGVVDPVSAGIPALGGSRVARFETTPNDIANGREHAKLYKAFGTHLRGPASRPPANVSGVYSAWFYFPKNYRVPGDSWVNLFQFKEEYRTTAGGHSDPLWWVQLGGARWASSMAQAYHEAPIKARPDAPVAFISHWNANWRAKRHFVPVPLGRWVALVAVLRQHRRIDFYLDGRRLDTGRASEYPVSPFHGSASMDWTFGIGNYSTAANGPLFADRASFSRF